MVHTMLLASNYIPVRGPEFQQIANFIHQGIRCDVVFGSPSSDCRGTGICKISGTNSLTILNQQKDCKRTQALMVENQGNQGITLLFLRPFLCTQLYRHHFRKGVLTMEEGCFLPAEIRGQMAIPYRQILPGTYQVVEEAGYFRIDLDCVV
jgi:hypothetical protein